MKKVGSSGKFAGRYGMRLRKKWLEVDTKQRAPHPCPVCNQGVLKRVSSGIWECRKCGAKLTGRAYAPMASISRALEKIEKPLVESEEKEDV